MKKHNVLWFFAGGSLTAVLCIGYGTVRYVPAAAAFGLLCFGTGVVLMQFLILRRQEEDSIKRELDSLSEWLKRSTELGVEQTNCEYEKLKWEEAREQLAEERELWKAEKDFAIKKEALRLLGSEAARRGGEQIKRDMNPNSGGPH